MKKLSISLLTLILVSFWSNSIKAQALSAELPKPKVMVAPWIPSLAMLLHVGGNVVVDVEIDSSGKVRSARAVDGHPLLRSVSVEAASAWIFEPGAGPRALKLIFVWPRLFGEGAVVTVRPYNAELVSTPRPPSDTESWRPDAFHDGKSRCKVHGVLLKNDRLEIIYGLTAYKVGYVKAQRKQFPNSNKSALGGCIREATKFAVVAYCPKCRRAEAKWSRAHRHEKRYSYTGA